MCDPVSAAYTVAAVTAVSAGASYSQQENAQRSAKGAADQARAQREAEATRQRQLEEERQARIGEGRSKIDENFGQFDDNFYNQRNQAYVDYASPELDKQYKDSMRTLVSALARSGNLQSSTRAEKFADLDEQYKQRKLDITNTGRDYSNEAKNAVERSRAELITQNESLADPNAISGNALARSQSLAQLPTFSPLGSILTDATQGLATQADLERRGQARYNTGLFTPRDSSRVVT